MIAAGEKLLGVLAGWRGYAAATIAGAALAWTVQGWRYGAELANQRATGPKRWPTASGKREILARRRAEVDGIDERNARAEWAAYGGCAMRKYRTMACGLILMLAPAAARPCPAAGGGMPEAGAATGVGHGTRAELDPAARSDYFALRAGIQQITAQLEACQARLRSAAPCPAHLARRVEQFVDHVAVLGHAGLSPHLRDEVVIYGGRNALRTFQLERNLVHLHGQQAQAFDLPQRGEQIGLIVPSGAVLRTRMSRRSWAVSGGGKAWQKGR